MGRKHSRSGKHFHGFAAVLILIALVATGCSFFASSATRTEHVDDADTHLAAGKTLFAREDYSAALKEYEKGLSLAPSAPSAEEAVFYIGLIYTAPNNPKRDAGKAIGYFKRLIKNYPGTPIAEHARIMTSVLQENDELSRLLEKQNVIIEQLKKVDMRIEDKRRERSK